MDQSIEIGFSRGFERDILVGEQIHRRRIAGGEQGGRDTRLETRLRVGVFHRLDGQGAVVGTVITRLL